MDDFSTPGKASVLGFSPQSPENFIVPGKRPMSSMSPMVIYNKNDGKVRRLAYCVLPNAYRPDGTTKIILKNNSKIVYNEEHRFFSVPAPA